MVFDYPRQTATIGPLSPQHEPGCYDLCLEHARHMRVPSGWHLQRVTHSVRADEAGVSRLAALADEVRRIGWRDEPPDVRPPDNIVQVARRGHLRVIADPGVKR